MAGEILSSTVSVDQGKMIAAKLLKRAYLKLVAVSICDKIKQEKGTGTTATFVRYKRMILPYTTLTEGTAPANSAISAETVTSSLDQWGDVVTISDVAQLTTYHPLFDEAQKLLADNAARVMDREVQIVMLGGTNVQYGDGSVTTRATITAAMKITDVVIEKATLIMEEAGAEPRTGPSNMKEQASAGPLSGSLRNGAHYVAVCGGQVVRDIRKNASGTGMWQSVSQYQNAKAIYTAEVGDYMGLRFVATNFIPKFVHWGNTTAAISAGAGTVNDVGGMTGVTFVGTTSGGSLTDAAQGFKITRKNMSRGFEEDISMIHTWDPNAGSSKFTLTFPADPSGTTYRYNVYVTDTYGTNLEANMKLHTANAAAGDTVTVLDKVSSTAAAAPPSLRAAGDASDPGTVYPVFILSNQAIGYVGLQDLKAYTVKGSSKSDPLDQKTLLGYKFMSKAVILDQTRILRMEVASAF